jgi:protein transport protein SEC20
MSSQPLSSRLHALSDTYKQTVGLIQRLQKLPANPGAVSPDADPLVELAGEIHQRLKEQEDALEILRQEADDGAAAENGPVGGRWVGGGSVMRRRDNDREQERERNAATIARLGEDLKT